MAVDTAVDNPADTLADMAVGTAASISGDIALDRIAGIAVEDTQDTVASIVGDTGAKSYRPAVDHTAGMAEDRIGFEDSTVPEIHFGCVVFVVVAILVGFYIADKA
ncbi:hypothetical protein N7493_000714 [Penicillium malachiteum]|uniref:Uncharacterized protein n=1 Tax=Penicillium malachiteum TaxID=1324776 RepID=A0AAD6HX75_9EURO|nr:hypothetical protein N7493_000714 [Penicillium malachiteum]